MARERHEIIKQKSGSDESQVTVAVHALGIVDNDTLRDALHGLEVCRRKLEKRLAALEAEE